jgi:hypothetical protein
MLSPRQHWNPTRLESVAVLAAGVGLGGRVLLSTSLAYFFFRLFALQIDPSCATNKKRVRERIDFCVMIDTEMVLDGRYLIGAQSCQSRDPLILRHANQGRSLTAD